MIISKEIQDAITALTADLNIIAMARQIQNDRAAGIEVDVESYDFMCGACDEYESRNGEPARTIGAPMYAIQRVLNQS